MKLAATSESLLEYFALRLNLVPTPVIDTQMAFTVARAIMTGAELGIFDARDLRETKALADELSS